MNWAGDTLELATDVLVIGGGPAGTWAASTAAAQGSQVVLCDKGFCGASGVAAAAAVGHWYLPPDPEVRHAAMRERDEIGGGLTQSRWQEKVLEVCWNRLPEITDDWGYPAAAFGGAPVAMQGLVYLRAMRRKVLTSGGRILDHSPVLELTTDNDGAVVGAHGVQRQKNRQFEIRAKAVVLAAGGCAFKSHCLGGDVDTGDGFLLAMEVGAQAQAMEYSNYYGVVPAGCTMDKNGYYTVATFSREDGSIIAEGWSGPLGSNALPLEQNLIRAGLDGPVFARLDLAPVERRPLMRAAMPNYFLAFDRLGIDPFTERFRIDFINEGTIRGTGGIRVVDDDCGVGVANLFVAGDAATREPIVGGASGAGSPNSAWAITSGTLAGLGAARVARRSEHRPVGPGVNGPDRLGVDRPRSGKGSLSWRELTRAVQAETLPIEKNGRREAHSMTSSLKQLDELWETARSELGSDDRPGLNAAEQQLRIRESVAMLAVARTAFASALFRKETRATHVRDDFPERDPRFKASIVASGLHEISLCLEPITTEEVMAS